MSSFQRFRDLYRLKRDALEPRKSRAFIRRVVNAADLKRLRLSRCAEELAHNDALSPAKRQQVINSYLKTLDALKSPIRSESELPFAKRVIQQAIVEELLENPETDLRSHLEVAYAEIESFVSVEEYELLQRFKETCTLAEELAVGGTPKDIVASSRLMERISGEHAVGVLERISHAMRERLRCIRSIGMMPSAAGFERASYT